MRQMMVTFSQGSQQLIITCIVPLCSHAPFYQSPNESSCFLKIPHGLHFSEMNHFWSPRIQCLIIGAYYVQ